VARKVLVGASSVVAMLVLVGTFEKPAAQNQEGGATGRTARAPRNRAEFDQMFDQVSNWGRWGKDDELGTANLLTDAKRKQAASLVKSGLSVSLAHNPLKEKAEDNPQPYEVTVAVPKPDAIGTGDTYRISYHGYAHSHLDALCHIFHKGMMYNGVPNSVVTAAGCGKSGIQGLKNGIVTRGILIDIPRLKGVPYLEPGTAVFPEDVEAWEKKAGLRVSSGDVIFLRTGRWARRAKVGAWAIDKQAAGFHASIAPWLKARGVAMLGSDAAADVTPSLVEGVGLPVHELTIAALGMNLFDNQDLEAVAETAAKLNRWEFMLSVAPMPVPGGTGFPVNALAIF
jgi:kynurenine formamidase